jgi:hypothetical protein
MRRAIIQSALSVEHSMRERRDDLQHRTDRLEIPNQVAEASPPNAGRRLPAWLAKNINEAPDQAIRDIRADLEQRASWLDEQIKAAQTDFKAAIEQLQHQHAAIVDDLKSQLDAVNLLIGFEERRVRNETATEE